MTQTLLVTPDMDRPSRDLLAAAIADAASIVYLTDVAPEQRAKVISAATVILARNTAKELQPAEIALIGNARLVQFLTAGIDYVPLAGFPPAVPVANNGGAYSESIAEHTVMMALAAFKRLLAEHRKLEAGTFDQFRPNRMLAGSVCGILGFGGIGIATARLMRAFGAEVHAINRRGASEIPIDWIGTDADLDRLLAVSDILVLSVPLTPATNGLIGARELALMKPDAVLINIARGEIVDEAALFAHLQRMPGFTACIDAWWIEPVRHGRFEMGHPFTSLPNVIASPHNSSSAIGARHVALQRAMENILRVLRGGEARNIVPRSDFMQ